MSRYMEKCPKKSWFRKIMDRLSGLHTELSANEKRGERSDDH